MMIICFAVPAVYRPMYRMHCWWRSSWIIRQTTVAGVTLRAVVIQARQTYDFQRRRLFARSRPRPTDEPAARRAPGHRRTWQASRDARRANGTLHALLCLPPCRSTSKFEWTCGTVTAVWPFRVVADRSRDVCQGQRSSCCNFAADDADKQAPPASSEL